MIQVTNLTKSYTANSKAVDQIDFSVPQGNILAIIGTSGCGKTTTLKMINRLIEPTHGDIVLDGKKFTQLDAISWRRGIGYVTQKAGLLPHLTVEQNISLLSSVLKKDKRTIKHRVSELLQLIPRKKL